MQSPSAFSFMTSRYVPPTQPIPCYKHSTLPYCRLVVSCIGIVSLAWCSCTSEGHVMVFSHLRTTFWITSAIIIWVGLCTPYKHDCRKYVCMLFTCVVVWCVILYWNIDASRIIPSLQLQENETRVWLYPHRLDNVSDWYSYPLQNTWKREEMDGSATNPIRLKWFDTCNVLVLPLLHSVFLQISHVLRTHNVQYHSTFTEPSHASPWRNTTLIETIICIRWMLECMNSIDTNDRIYVDVVSMILLFGNMPALVWIWKKKRCSIHLTFLKLLPNTLAWLLNILYSVYWHRQYKLGNYDEQYRSVWYDGVWWMSVIRMWSVLCSFYHYRREIEREENDHVSNILEDVFCSFSISNVHLFLFAIVFNMLFIGYTISKHILLPHEAVFLCGMLCITFGLVSPYVYKRKYGTYAMCVPQMVFMILFVVHGVVWFILESNINSRHLTEYMDMLMLIQACFSLLGVVA